MKYRLVAALPQDGIPIDVGEGQSVLLQGGVGRASIVVVPRAYFDGLGPEAFGKFVERTRETILGVAGIRDVLIVCDDTKFMRLVPEEEYEELSERVDKALTGVEACCLDDEEDRARVVAALVAALA
jgi:hypothetical protein